MTSILASHLYWIVGEPNPTVMPCAVNTGVPSQLQHRLVQQCTKYIFLYLCDLLWYLRSSCFFLAGILFLLFFSLACNNINDVLIFGYELTFQFIFPHCETAVLIYLLWTVVFPDVLTFAYLHIEYIQCSTFKSYTETVHFR